MKAAVNLTEEEEQELLGLFDKMTDDDLEVREEAAKRIKEFGKAVRPRLKKRLEKETDRYARMWLRKLQNSLVRSVDSWRNQTRAISGVIVVGGTAQMTANERNASGSLKTLATAQADFRSNDRDANMVNDFWVADVRGLYSLDDGTGNEIKLIERTIRREPSRQHLRRVDAHHRPSAPKVRAGGRASRVG